MDVCKYLMGFEQRWMDLETAAHYAVTVCMSDIMLVVM